MSRRSPIVSALVVLGGLGVITGCGGDGGGGDTAAFCQSLTNNHQQLFVDVPASEQAADDLVGLMRELGDQVPLAIEQEWSVLIEVFEQVAASETPGSQADLAAIYASERSAVAVQTWARTNCGLEIAVGRVPEPTGAGRLTATTIPAAPAG